MLQPSSQGTLKPDSSGYLSEQTIAALATAVGGAIAVVRISGPKAFMALDSLAGAEVSRRTEPRKLTRITLREPMSGAVIDDALFACFRNPESYTGEDVVELHIHGGSFTASRLLESLRALEIRQALPGEFSFRAIRNGKMTLGQAEAVADLIAASNEDAVALALEKLSGSQNRLLSVLGEDLRKLCSLGEVGIDFADQDVEELGLPRLKARLDGPERTLRQLRDSFSRGSRLQEGVSVAFVGLPNAGKSSFFNALLGEDRALVSEIPGTTRDVLRERITLQTGEGSVTLRLEDTAGLRRTSDEIEKAGIERSHRAASSADLVVFLVDATAPLEPALEEWDALQAKHSGLATKSLGVFTKWDLLENRNAVEILSNKMHRTGVKSWEPTSALTGDGIHRAAARVAQMAASLVSRQKGEVLLTRLDQLTAIEAGLNHLTRARNATEIELFASDIRHALHALGPLIGETLPDDILGRIFSDFCIGK